MCIHSQLIPELRSYVYMLENGHSSAQKVLEVPRLMRTIRKIEYVFTRESDTGFAGKVVVSIVEPDQVVSSELKSKITQGQEEFQTNKQVDEWSK